MVTGDLNDFLGRLKALLPPKWFPDVAPVRDGLLSAGAAALSRVFSQIAWVMLQTRLATSTTDWLDARVADFFGAALLRRPNELDPAFSLRARHAIIRPRITRPAVIEAVTDLVGTPPVVIEPWYPLDTGAWDIPVWGWDVAGSWGDLSARYQSFLIITRPTVMGQASGLGGWDTAVCGWDVGAWAWTDGSLPAGAVTDDEIYATVTANIAAGTTAWVQLID